MIFQNAQEAFEHLYFKIKTEGIKRHESTSLFNQGFTILNPMDNHINTPWRKWSHKYAQAEWEW